MLCLRENSYVITSTGYFREGGIEYVPIYMVHLIVDAKGVPPLNLHHREVAVSARLHPIASRCLESPQ